MDDKQAPRVFEWEPRRTSADEPVLYWTGKQPCDSVRYYHARLKEAYGAERDGWRNKLFWGDNLCVMGHLMRDFRGKIDFIYIDPPFNSRSDYKKPIKLRQTDAESQALFSEKQYGDIWTNDAYLQFMYERITVLRELLSDTGVLVLHCDWHKNAYLRMILDEVFGADRYINEIAWCYTSGGVGKSAFGRKHDTLYVYSKTERYTFHEQYYKRYALIQNGVEVGFDPRVTYYKDENGRSYRRNLSVDWWSDIGIVSPNSRTEKTGYPTQKPEALIERLIAAFTDAGDLVLDCFMGSGTAQAVSLRLQRRFIGADINFGAVQTTVERLLGVASKLRQAGSTGAETGFTVSYIDRNERQSESEAEVVIENQMLIIKHFLPKHLAQRLSAEQELPDDWRRTVASVMIDFHYDGAVMQPEMIDIPIGKGVVVGHYSVPKDAGRVLVKITDVLSHVSESELWNARG